MSISITVDGEAYDVPSSAADVNWAADQVAFEQALATYLNTTGTASAALALAVKPAAVVGTAGSGTGYSASSTSYGRNVVHKITLGYAAPAALGIADFAAFTLWTLPAKTRVLRVIADVTEEFDGGSTSAFTIKVGRSSGGEQYLLSADAHTAPIVVGNAQAELGTGVVGGASFDSDITWSSTTVVQAFLEATGDVFGSLDQGSVTFYVECCAYP